MRLLPLKPLLRHYPYLLICFVVRGSGSVTQIGDLQTTDYDARYTIYLASCILISLIFIRVHLINSWLITLKLSHQNHQKTWSPRADSNRRPHPYQGCALPSELRGPSSDRAGDGIRTRDPQLGRLML